MIKYVIKTIGNHQFFTKQYKTEKEIPRTYDSSVWFKKVQ
jgi:hypothetical protein